MLFYTQFIRRILKGHCHGVSSLLLPPLFTVFGSILYVLKSLLSPITETQNSPAKLRGRYDVKFSRERKSLFIFGSFNDTV